MGTRQDLVGLLNEQVALPRVATLIAEEAPLTDVLDVVVAEVARVLGVPSVLLERYEDGPETTVLAVTEWDGLEPGSRRPLESGSLATSVRQTGLPSEIARRAAVPVIVNDEVWGLMSVRAECDGALPDTTETRLRKLAELVAMAIAQAHARDELHRLADEHAALRRVATLVADGTDTDAVLEAICAEAGRVLAVPAVAIERDDGDGSTTVLATWVDLDRGKPGAVEASWVGVPITVEGKTWGVIRACTSELSAGALPADVQSWLAGFTDLIAIAVSNVHARNELRGIADEQASLRCVATTVAEGTSIDRVFAAVCEEAGRLLGVPGVFLESYDKDGCVTILATWGEMEAWNRLGLDAGTRWPLDGPSIARRVLDSGRPAIITDYSELPGTIAALVRKAPAASMAGVPITVEGNTWGVLIACTDGLSATRLPAYVEAQLSRFTDLISIAISNAQARDELRSLAEEQAALRRIATLVARGSDERLVFDAVCTETGRLVGAAMVNLVRFTPDAHGVVVAGWSIHEAHLPVGTRASLGEDSISGTVWRTGRRARRDSYEHATGELARLVRSAGARSSLGVPIVVEGRLWGVLIPGLDSDETFPPGADEQVARFAELTATSISNATARSELIASRARIVTAADEARRRIERNLHDGIQQRLIALSLDLESVRETMPPEDQDARLGLDRISRELEAVHDDLRQLSHGLHPAILSRRGLAAALAGLARTSPIPVSLDTDIAERQPAPVEIGIYYVVSEALTNAAKHSGASEISVSVVRKDDRIRATISDDGVGGADPGAGSGLTGLTDRVAALGGKLEIESRPAAGTTIRAVVPIGNGQR